jgi:hypothetical protein
MNLIISDGTKLANANVFKVPLSQCPRDQSLSSHWLQYGLPLGLPFELLALGSWDTGATVLSPAKNISTSSAALCTGLLKLYHNCILADTAAVEVW